MESQNIPDVRTKERLGDGLVSKAFLLRHCSCFRLLHSAMVPLLVL